MVVERDDNGPVPVALRVDDAAYWIEEWHRATELPGNQVTQTLAAREHDFEQRQDTRNRVRLALLLTEGPPALRDHQRALSLLTGIDSKHSSDSARALAALLLQVIREQSTSDGKITTLTATLQQANERVKELERQLQELTNIEQSIQQRESPLDGKEK
jgi:phage shock protein A